MPDHAEGASYDIYRGPPLVEENGWGYAESLKKHYHDTIRHTWMVAMLSGACLGFIWGLFTAWVIWRIIGD